MNHLLFKTITVAALSLLSITGITPPTSAEDRDLYQELIELYPEMKQASREFLIDVFAKQAEKFGYAPDEYLEQIIEETRLNDEVMHQSIDIDGSELLPGLILPYDIEKSPYTKKNWEVR